MAGSKEMSPAAELAAKASKPFPGDSEEYRKARTALLAEEIELRRHIERVGAQRRALPLGGEVPKDYEFTSEDGRKLRLSEMFGNHSTLVVYSWMYGPERDRPCPMCTGFLGPLESQRRRPDAAHRARGRRTLAYRSADCVQAGARVARTQALSG